MMTRRTFVGALTTVTTACGLGLLGGVVARRRRLSMAEIGPATLRPLRGKIVDLRADGGRTLRAVVDDVHTVRYPARYGAPGTEQISLLLAADDRDAPAGTYRIDSKDVSLGDLYFSPVGPAGRERRLEAVITRIL